MPADISAASVVVQSKGQLSTTLGGEVVILSVDDGVYYGLTEVGARIWALIQAPRAIDAIVDAVVTEYEVTREQAAADVRALVGDLVERGLVVIASSGDR